jgi:hypothetical protein
MFRVAMALQAAALFFGTFERVCLPNYPLSHAFLQFGRRAVLRLSAFFFVSRLTFHGTFFAS